MKITKEQLVNLIGESTYDNLKEMAQLSGGRHKHGYEAGQAGGEKVHKNFTRISINTAPQEGEPKIIYGDLKKYQEDPRIVLVGWRLFEGGPGDADDVYFLEEREQEEFLRDFNVEVNQIIEASGLSPERVRWVNKRVGGSKGKLPTRDPRRASFGTYAFAGSGADETQVVDSPDTRYKGKPITKDDRQDVWRTPWDDKERYLRDTAAFDGRTVPGLYTIMKDILNAPEVLEHMAKCALPTIHPNERPFLDRHNEQSNNFRNEYATHSIIYFPTQEEFYKSILSRIKQGVDLNSVVEQDQRMRYQFNRIYSNYRPDKATVESSSAVKTPIYQLNERDYTRLGLDVCIMGLLNIKGSMSQDQTTYSWSATYTSKWGKKLRTEISIKQGLQPDLDLSVTKTCQIEKSPEEPEFSQFHVITHNESIRNCFIETLTELKDKIMSVKVSSGLTKAIPTQSQIDRTKPQNP